MDPSIAAVAAAAAAQERRAETSTSVIRRFLRVTVGPAGERLVDASRVLTAECYQEWLRTRGKPMAQPERTFQRVLTCTITGTDGRRPFEAPEEAAILRELRQKRTWPAFENTPHTIGRKGFRGKGFHEKKQIARAAPDDDSAAPTPPQRPKRPRDEVTAIALLAEAAEGAGQRLARSLANTDGPPPTLLHSTATPPPPPPPPASPVRAVRPARN